MTPQDAPAMPEPLELLSGDGARLRAAFYPGADPRGVLVVSHGLGEHSGCYEGFAATLAATPGLVDVLAFDYRGHGLSPGKRGFVRLYEEFLGDLRAAIDRAASLRPGSPLFLFGHSNGGLVALHEALADGGRLAGLILSNPSLKVIARVPRHKYLAGLLLRRFGPGVTLTSTVLDEHLTRDPASLARRKADTLRHGRINAPLYFGMVEGGESALARAGEVLPPVLLVLGGSDPVIDPGTTRAFFDRLGSRDKTVKVFPEMLHEPLNDIGAERVVEEIVGWLAGQLSSIEARVD